MRAAVMTRKATNTSRQAIHVRLVFVAFRVISRLRRPVGICTRVACSCTRRQLQPRSSPFPRSPVC